VRRAAHRWIVSARRTAGGWRGVLLLVVCAAGCGDDGDGDDGGNQADAAVAPGALRVSGAAAGEERGGTDRVECTFALDFIDLVDDGARGFTGVAAGEVFRRTFDGDAIRFEFSALVGGPATLSAGGGGSVELRLVGDQPSDAVPFWLALEALDGSETEPFEYDGEWLCATVLVGDPMDSPIEAPGSWTAAPLVPGE
jgi:hypothetical protein